MSNGNGYASHCKMREILNEGTYNTKLLEISGLRENSLLPSSSLSIMG